MNYDQPLDLTKHYILRNGTKVFLGPGGGQLVNLFDLSTGKRITNVYKNGRALFSGTHAYDVVAELKELKGGKTYTTRDGKHQVKVRNNDQVSIWPLDPFEGDVLTLNGRLTISYRADGKQDSQEEHPLDLMIPDTAVPSYHIQGQAGGRASLFFGDTWIGKFQNKKTAEAYLEFLKNQK